MNVIEIFCCSGGMAEGLRRAGVAVTMAVDYDRDACASYEANLGRAPVRLDVRELTSVSRGRLCPDCEAG